MMYYMVAIYDLKVAAFSRPQFVRSQGEAMRSFQQEVNRAPSENMPNQLHTHAEDFQLFFMGEFDDNTGKFRVPDIPEKIADAASLKV